VHLFVLSGLQSRQQLFPSATLLVLKSTVLTACCLVWTDSFFAYNYVR